MTDQHVLGQTIHVLLDLVSAYNRDQPDNLQQVMDVALPRLGEIGAVEAESFDSGETFEISATLLVTAAMVLVDNLAGALVSAMDDDGTDRDYIIVWLREWADLQTAAPGR